MKPALLVFARAPLPGRAKTRLARQIGPVSAARAYERLLVRVVGRVLAAANEVDVVLYAASIKDRDWLALRWPDIQTRVQQGRHLGTRLRSAFDEQFRLGRPRVIAVGTDIPELNAAIVRSARKLLDRFPVVIGPTEDGGYYLIGLRACRFELFQGIDWGTSRVLAQTLRRASPLGLRVGRLPKLYDVDLLPDWFRYLRQVRSRVEPEPKAERCERSGKGPATFIPPATSLESRVGLEGCRPGPTTALAPEQGSHHYQPNGQDE